MRSMSKKTKAVLGGVVLLVLFAATLQTEAQETCLPPPLGMVAWWPGDGNTDEIVGARNGSMVGSAGFAPGMVANSFSFDGNGWIDVRDDPIWTLGTKNFTIELWVSFNSLSGRDPLIAHDNGAGEQDKWIFWYDGEGHDKQQGVPALRFHINSPHPAPVPFPHDTVVAPWNPRLERWYHVAVTRSGSRYTLYIDGAQVATDTSAFCIPDPAAALTIGRAESIRLNGLVDEVAIFHRALSASEIQAIFNAGRAGKCKARATEQRTVVVDGIARTYYVNPGRDAATTPSPLVFAFHGLGSSPGIAQSWGIASAWPEATVVYPQGMPPNEPGWQFGLGDSGDQDVRFVDAMLTDLARAYRVDLRRVYTTGHSNGGALSFVLLAARPERFAAVASVNFPDAGNLPWAAVPRPALYISGDQDTGHNPGDGAEWVRDQLLRLNGAGSQGAEWMPGVFLYPPAASGQPVLYSRFPGGHEWPPMATPAIVKFFQAHALPTDPRRASPPAWGSAGEVVAGTGDADHTGDRGLATAARVCFPYDVTVDAAGRLIIADDSGTSFADGYLRRVTEAGIISTVDTVAAPGFNPRPRRQSPIYSSIAIKAITVDRAGNLYFADDVQRRVVRIGADGLMRSVAGIGPPDTTGIRFSGDGGPGVQAQISFPEGLAVDGEGNLFIADTANHRVRQVGADGIIRTVAGIGTPGYSGDNGPALQAQLYHPWGLAIDRDGNLLIADAGNHCIRKMSRGGRITTVAGDGTAGSDGDDGPATAARLRFPAHIAVDSQGQIFIADGPSHRIRKVGQDGSISTLVGEGGTVDPTPVASPAGMVIDRSGNLYLADPTRHVIRKFAGVAATGLIAGAPLP